MKKCDLIALKRKSSILLRFHTTAPSQTSPVFASYADIARILKITYNQA